MGAEVSFLSPYQAGAGGHWQHRIEVEHQLHLLGRSDADVADILRAGARANVAASAVQVDLQARGFACVSGQLGALNEGITALGVDVREGFGQLAQGMDDLAGGISEVGEAVSAGFAQMAAEMAADRRVLSDIRDILRELLAAATHPRATEAAEKARQGKSNFQDALQLSGTRQARLLEEAVAELTESVAISPYDFDAQFHLGLLYLLYRHDATKATEHFDTAVLRSLVKAPAFASYALRHLALARRAAGDLAEAYEATREALELTPDTQDLLYDHARYAALTGHVEEAAAIVRRLLGDSAARYYEAAAEPDFACLNDTLDALLDEAKRDVRALVEPVLADWQRFRDEHVFIDAEAAGKACQPLLALEEASRASTYAGFRGAAMHAPEARSVLQRLQPGWQSVRLCTTLGHHTKGVQRVCFSPDSRWLITVGDDARLWAAGCWEEAARIPAGWLEFSSDGRFIALVVDKSITLWEVDPLRSVFTTPTGEPTFLLLSPDSRWVVWWSYGAGGITVRCNDRDEPTRILKGDFRGRGAAAFSPDCRWLATRSYDDRVTLWEVGHWRAGASVGVGHGGELTFSPDGRWLASRQDAGGLALWDLNVGLESVHKVFDPPDSRVAEWSPDGRWLAAAQCDGTVRLHRTGEWQDFRPIRAHADAVYWAKFSIDGRWLNTRGGDSMSRVWDTETCRLALETHVGRVEFATDDNVVALGHNDAVELWDLSRGKRLRSLYEREGRCYATFSPDGRWLVAHGNGPGADVWSPLVRTREDAARLVSGDEARRLAQADSRRRADETRRREDDERHRRAEEARRQQEEQRLRQHRIQNGLCVKCGTSLGFFDKVAGRDTCGRCR